MTLASCRQRTGCCTVLLHKTGKAPSQTWKRGFDLRWSQGDSNP